MKIKILIISFFSILVSCSSTNNNQTKDGSSIENAIKVTDAAQEYAIIRKVCPDCELKGQSLISDSKGTKHYDVLTLAKPDGTEVKYYFDINSFYGKW